MKTYRAFYQDDHSKILFRGQPAAKVRELLPTCKVAVDTRSSVGREKGDQYEFALFESGGKLIVVIPDPVAGISVDE